MKLKMRKFLKGALKVKYLILVLALVLVAVFLGFGGGVMVAASFFSLLLPAIDFCNILKI